MSLKFLPLLHAVLLAVPAWSAYTWPNLAYDFIEEFLWLELTGFAAIPAACGPNTANPDGTTPSIQAQWLRTVRWIICFDREQRLKIDSGISR